MNVDPLGLGLPTRRNRQRGAQGDKIAAAEVSHSAPNSIAFNDVLNDVLR